MKVEECMTTRVFSCRPDTSMEQAARLMWEQDCGVLPVVDERDRIVALVTDRDLCMGSYTRGKALSDLCVENSMSKRVFSCQPADLLEDALRTMADHQVRRVPVVDAAGKLLGILSLNDLFRRILTMRDARLRSSLSTRLIEAMAAICEPHESRSELEVATAVEKAVPAAEAVRA
jgi:CBS domain-containing protein